MEQYVDVFVDFALASCFLATSLVRYYRHSLLYTMASMSEGTASGRVRTSRNTSAENKAIQSMIKKVGQLKFVTSNECSAELASILNFLKSPIS